MRYSNTSRRGRALFVLSLGIGLLVLASGFFLLRAVGSTEFVSVGSAMTLLACAMLIVATGSLLPTVEDWGARREMRTIEPLLRELCVRQPDVGVGVRPRGPLAPGGRADVVDLGRAFSWRRLRRTTRPALADSRRLTATRRSEMDS